MKKKTALSFLGLGLIGMVAVPGFGLSKAKAADQDVVCLTCHTPQGGSLALFLARNDGFNGKRR